MLLGHRCVPAGPGSVLLRVCGALDPHIWRAGPAQLEGWTHTAGGLDPWGTAGLRTAALGPQPLQTPLQNRSAYRQRFERTVVSQDTSVLSSGATGRVNIPPVSWWIMRLRLIKRQRDFLSKGSLHHHPRVFFPVPFRLSRWFQGRRWPGCSWCTWCPCWLSRPTALCPFSPRATSGKCR